MHYPAIRSTDFTRIDAMIDRADEIFAAANETTTVGIDGWSLVGVQRQGRSPDITDSGDAQRLAASQPGSI